MNAYIISYNRLTYLQSLCTELVKRGCTPVIIDNRSTYQPLLNWLNDCPYKVYTVPNTGSKSPWLNNLIDDDYYIVTDHDIDISGCPLNMVEILMQGLEESPTSIKCGLSLTIDDLPENRYTDAVKEIESRYWQTKIGVYYSAPVDTTLALYSAERMRGMTMPFKDDFFNAVRTPPPYSARHLPWYNEPGNLSDEEKYYLNTITSDGHWMHEFKRMYYD